MSHNKQTNKKQKKTKKQTNELTKQNITFDTNLVKICLEVISCGPLKILRLQ